MPLHNFTLVFAGFSEKIVHTYTTSSYNERCSVGGEKDILIQEHKFNFYQVTGIAFQSGLGPYNNIPFVNDFYYPIATFDSNLLETVVIRIQKNCCECDPPPALPGSLSDEVMNREKLLQRKRDNEIRKQERRYGNWPLFTPILEYFFNW